MFVLDASVALAWCLPDETNAYADPVLHRLAHETALVPTIWPIEVTNALVVGIRQGRLTREQALHLLNELPIEVDVPIWSRIFDVFRKVLLSVAGRQALY
ncbi:MAG: type II toxin-antitoxin system VapC family toxin [Sulfobacillus sp.]|nr:type II toxin-antitoxin system VapC family toxin [Sulfobacillus sp.]